MRSFSFFKKLKRLAHSNDPNFETKMKSILVGRKIVEVNKIGAQEAVLVLDDGTRRSVSAHRLSYEVFKGVIPKGMEVCHKCDNPCCVNPDHLFVGTRQDNVDDRESKGRGNPLKGVCNGMAKLNEEKVMEARRERLLNGTSFQKLADKYGVSKKTMQNAISGKNWACVNMPEPPEVE